MFVMAHRTLCILLAMSSIPAMSAGSRSSLIGESLEFQRVEVDTNPPVNPWVKISGDFNRDGKLDIAIAGEKGPLVWYRNPDWAKFTVAQSGWETVGGTAADIDADGDLDVVPGAQVWFENPLPKGDPERDTWTPHRIGNIRSHDVAAADLDHDGRLELVARDQSGFGHRTGNFILIWRQTSTSQWESNRIDCPHGEGLALADLDRDGDLDIAIAALWFENPGTKTGSWAEHRFTTRWIWPDAKLVTADFNSDGRVDIALAPAEYQGQRYRLSWFKAHQHARKPHWKETIVAVPIEAVMHGLQVADMDLDGHPDLISASMHQGAAPREVAIHSNPNHGKRSRKHVVATTGSHDIIVADFNGDGRPDILGANHGGDYHPVEVWLSCGSAPRESTTK
jgi:hypothetical protein